jgi:hypothetical protein
VSPVKYELGFYIPEDDVLHGHRREISNLARNEKFIRNYILIIRGAIPSRKKGNVL